MNYSIRFKDQKGITSRSEFLPFDNDLEAIGYGRTNLAERGATEVWKGDDLLARLSKDASEATLRRRSSK